MDPQVGGPRPGPDGSPPPPPTIEALATTFGLDASGAREIRAASRHVVRFPSSRVLTVASVADLAGPRREAAMARLLAEAGVPATRCLAGPAVVDGWAVTAWREVAPLDPGTEADAVALGGVAARFHRSTGGLDARGIPPCDPVGAALAQVAAAVEVGSTDEGDLAVLRREATRVEEVWRRALTRSAEAGRGATTDPAEGTEPGDRSDGGDDRWRGAVVHGDLHAGNVIVGRDGPLAIDLELAGWGPRAYDAAPTVAFVRWYGRPEADLAAFDTAYGAPLTQAARDLGLDEVWALWSTAWAVANRHRSPEAEDEAAVRLATWATGTAPRPWRLR